MWKAEFLLGINNGWWFLISFIAINCLYMVIFPAHYRNRIFQLPDMSGKKLVGIFYAVSLNGTLIYSIFVTIKINTIYFWIGLGVFIIGAVLFFVALYNYATTSPDKPVVKGVYRYTRNPQQILAVFMWIGIGIATTSYIIIILCICQLFLMYPTILSQEEFCIEKYKQDYVDYMNVVPRYFWKI